MLSLAPCSTFPALLSALHSYLPPSSTLARLMLTWETTSPCTVTYWPIRKRSDLGREKPFSVQATLGVGLPRAEHFRETGGPGWRVCNRGERKCTVMFCGETMEEKFVKTAAPTSLETAIAFLQQRQVPATKWTEGKVFLPGRWTCRSRRERHL